MGSVMELHILLDDLLNIQTGAIKLGIPPLIGTLFFPDIARNFHMQYPKVRLELVERGAKMIGTLVENGEVDIGIVVLPTDERKFSVQPFVEDQFFVFINDSHPLALKKYIQLEDLKKMRPSLSLRRNLHYMIMSLIHVILLDLHQSLAIKAHNGI